MTSQEVNILESYAGKFYDLSGMTKIAIIRKRKGKWVVLSRKGKVLGTYNTRKAAEKRLRQIEFWKHKKAQIKNPSLSYSSVVRLLNDQYSKSTVDRFQKLFKENFDKLYLEGYEEPEDDALEQAISAVNIFKKKASAIEMGDPIFAGKKLSDLIRFLLRRIPEGKRQKAIQSMKKKIFMINEYDLSSKSMPPYSSMANSLTIVKNILLENEPEYIRMVLNSIVKNL